MAKEVNGYQDLVVWQKAMQVVYLIYELTRSFPVEERYGLSSQMRRSAVSIPSNIAEGRHRGSRKNYSQFLIIAYGSVAELETQLLIAKHLNYITTEQFNETYGLISECSKMLNKMINTLRT